MARKAKASGAGRREQMTVDRRWSAKIRVEAQLGFVGAGEIVDATQSEYDLQADQAKVAIKEAGEYIDAGLGEACYVTLYKTTAKGTARDKFFSVYRDSRTGKLIAQR